MRKHDIIVDASILAKWFLQDEEDREAAFYIHQDFANQRISIILPNITLLEVNNTFKSAVLQKRLTKLQALEMYKLFLRLDFLIYSSSELLQMSLETAINMNISSYDAIYVALAEDLKVPFYTADQKLLINAKSKLVIDLKHYPSN